MPNPKKQPRKSMVVPIHPILIPFPIAFFVWNFRLRFGLLADEQSGVGDRNALAAWSRSCDGGTRGHPWA